MRRSVMAGVGRYLPERIVTNAELAKTVDTSDEWIRERSGITQRYIAAEGEFTSDLATHAAREALKSAGMEPDDIDLIVVATSTPDETFPASATVVQSKLGCTNGSIGFDVQAVCSGFVYALATADNFIKSGQVDTALVIGAETFSRILDWEDRGTCVLFGDGAGAIVLRGEEEAGTSDDRGVLSTHLHSDGSLHDLLYVDGGPSSTGRWAICAWRAVRCSGMRSRRCLLLCSKPWRRRACRPRMSIGLCRIRPTSGSSTVRRESWGRRGPGCGHHRQARQYIGCIHPLGAVCCRG